MSASMRSSSASNCRMRPYDGGANNLTGGLTSYPAQTVKKALNGPFLISPAQAAFLIQVAQGRAVLTCLG